MIDWRWRRFEELSLAELYDFLQLRSRVFVVEQNCIYQDLDGVDQNSFHLLGYEKTGALAVYLRSPFAGVKFIEASIGRVVTAPEFRGAGLGKLAMEEALRLILAPSLRISAQQYLENFYKGFGFQTLRGPYDEDGIPHIEMLWKPRFKGRNF